MQWCAPLPSSSFCSWRDRRGLWGCHPSANVSTDAGAAGAGAGSQVVASAPQHLTKGSSRLGIFYRLTKQNPTNYDMLVFR